jgi:phosphoribosyl-ATP pyrophosphohydrolase/phosphoribosyl-AMP cyclohydrolase
MNSMTVDFDKYPNGLVPAIIQDAVTGTVLMLGFMNSEAVQVTRDSGKVTFYSRSKQRLWTKGEESGHFLHLHSMQADCDADTLLVKVHPVGAVCHTGTDTCWNEVNAGTDFITELEAVIARRKTEPASESYTSSLFAKGINKVAQKVGEEAVELVIEAKDSNDELFKNEAADLLFHYLVLLQAKGFTLRDVIAVLKGRHKEIKK